MGNKYNVYIWVVRGEEEGMLAGQYYWKVVYAGEVLIGALIAFIKHLDKTKTGCVKLEGRP
jgi:hypothetical protein